MIDDNEPEEKPEYPYDELMPFEAYWRLFKCYTRKLIWITGFWSIIIAILDYYRNFESSFTDIVFTTIGPAFVFYMLLAIFFLHVFKTHAFYAGHFGLQYKDFWMFALAALVCVLFLNSFNIAVWIQDSIYPPFVPTTPLKLENIDSMSEKEVDYYLKELEFKNLLKD